MAAAVHLVHICSSYISNTSVAGRLMLRDLIFFSSPLSFPTSISSHPLTPILDDNSHFSGDCSKFRFQPKCAFKQLPMSGRHSSLISLHPSVNWDKMFSFMRMHAPSLAVCLKVRLISFVKTTKTLKMTASMPVITFLFYLHQFELTDSHLMQAATCWIGGRHFSFQSKALQNRCYHLPPLFFATWNCTYGKPTRSWDSPSNLSTIWSPPPARPCPISLRGYLRSWSNFSFNGTSG